MRLPPRSECLQLVQAIALDANGQAASAASEQTLDNLARAIGCSWQLWQLLQWSNFASHSSQARAPDRETREECPDASKRSLGARRLKCAGSKKVTAFDVTRGKPRPRTRARCDS